MTVQEVLTLRVALLHAGYFPLPLIGKKPAPKEWQKRIDTSEGDIQIWSKVYPTADNTGVLTRLVPALDLDLLNADAAAAAEEFVRERYEEGGYVLTRIGRAPKRAILFRTEEPFSKIVANLVAPNGSAEKIEFLADGQQLACFGIHPETKRPYSWHKNAPGEIAREDLPYIREAEARVLVDGLAEMLVADFGYVRAPERPRRKKNGPDTGKTYDGAADWQYLVDRIRAGEALHDSLRDLAAKLVTSGMVAGAVVNFLQALMESSSAPRDERWLDRLNEIPRLVDSAERLKEKAEPETAETVAPLPKQTLAEVHAVFKRWLGTGYDLDAATAAMAAAASERLDGDPLWLLIVAGPGGAKSQALRIIKAPVGAGNLAGADLGDYGVAIGAWTDSMRTQSAFYRVLSDGGFTRVPVNPRVGITVAPVTAAVRAEGHAIAMSPLQLSNVMLTPTLASSLLVVTDELLRDVSAAGQQALNRALMGAVSDAVDAAFLDMIVSTGTTSIASGGGTATDAKADLRAALMAVNSIGSAKLYWIAGVDVAKGASTLTTADGADAFPAMSAMGGEIANLPAVVSGGIAADSLVLIDASGIAADGGPVTVSASSQADVLMDSAPSMSSAVPTPASMVSMFQSNSTALKADAWFAAQVLRDDAVAVITGISWGG